MMRLGIPIEAAYLLILTCLIFFAAVATGYGQWASSRAASIQQQQRIRIVNSRVRSSWWLIGIFAVAFWLGQGALLVVFAFISFFLLREFIALTPTHYTDHWALVIAFYVAIPVQYLLIAYEQYLFFTIFIPVYLFLLLPVVMAASHDTDRYLERVAKVQWGIMLAIFCVSHAPAISLLDFNRFSSNGPLMLVYFLMMVFFADLFAVLMSSILGGRPLQSNPNKTVKGTLAGSAMTLLCGLALFWLTPFRLWQAGLMTLAIIIAALMGDLVISSVKKSLGASYRSAEDDVYITRGVLERMAPLTFAAPVFYHLIVIFFMN
ncbi:phosphatidate cytidylyltransferase [Mesosutterella sp. OilRF-GAM-744-9]|uniref:Phosphatidate cytidylyltransferase n=1 Tax=Mesosutterella porci TaxID=2915351 RepID=A0ABS9MNY8_9BURK|nr:phosphatidate cytidylyltransferase [Mesosutterella sp. oilRF-744-WT-GAM-9]MCG5030325.1 phosphatidate cytidylyltransferase [Mesosutterella sp. oilRF-744-WT-GAM-9]MCI6530605.1 phosphatidate cytidylyltransferase [Mesosutterella sp.]